MIIVSKGMSQNKFGVSLNKTGAGSAGIGGGPAISGDFLSPPSAHSSSSSSRHLAAFYSAGEQLTSPDKRKSSDSSAHQQQPLLPAHQHQQHTNTSTTARNSVFRFVIRLEYALIMFPFLKIKKKKIKKKNDIRFHSYDIDGVLQELPTVCFLTVDIT